MRWSPGVVLGVLLTQHRRSDRLLETIQRILPNLHTFHYCIMGEKKKSQEGKSRKPKGKGIFLSEVPLMEISLVSLGLRSVCVLAAVCTQAV